MASLLNYSQALNVLHYSGAAYVLKPFFKGKGAIFMLHHVTPGKISKKKFAPNSGLHVTPEFLEAVIKSVKRKGFEILSLEHAVDRLSSPDQKYKPFVVFTLDDAPRDNFNHAWPVFKRNNCPFTVFATTGFQDRTAVMWWCAVEKVINDNKRIFGAINNEIFDYRTETLDEKNSAWESLSRQIRELDQVAQSKWVREFCDRFNVSVEEICNQMAMSWDELITMSQDPLCTIGAHTLHHYAVKRLSESDARDELLNSKKILEQKLGKPIHTLAYPYGDKTSAGPRDFNLAKQAGYKVAVTTRKGLLFSQHREHLLALPRLSLSGQYQNIRYVNVLLSGLPFALFKKFKKIDVK